MLVKTREIYLKTKFYRPENPSVLCWIKTYHWQIRCDAVASSIWGGFWGFQFRISWITSTIAQPFFCCKKLIPCLCPQTLFFSATYLLTRNYCVTYWKILSIQKISASSFIPCNRVLVQYFSLLWIAASCIGQSCQLNFLGSGDRKRHSQF